MPLHSLNVKRGRPGNKRLSVKNEPSASLRPESLQHHYDVDISPASAYSISSSAFAAVAKQPSATLASPAWRSTRLPVPSVLSTVSTTGAESEALLAGRAGVRAGLGLLQLALRSHTLNACLCVVGASPFPCRFGVQWTTACISDLFFRVNVATVSELRFKKSLRFF
uniref:Uncharacterized protein n=1 Tax=Dunaliella tertiolecta TaxID=3047 RepID=A0A7S3VHC7_DUNTE